MPRTATLNSSLPRMRDEVLALIHGLVAGRQRDAARRHLSRSPSTPSLWIDTDRMPSPGAHGRSTAAPAPSPNSTAGVAVREVHDAR